MRGHNRLPANGCRSDDRRIQRLVLDRTVNRETVSTAAPFLGIFPNSTFGD